MILKDRCDIILPTCEQVGLIRNCIESLIRHTKYPVRLIAIDDGKFEESSELLRGYAKSGRIDMILIKPPENLGWVRAINRGLEESTDSKYVSFQNDDTVFTEGWLEELIGLFEADPGIGIINPEWEIPEGADIDAFAAGLKKYAGQAVDTDYCRGHCFVIRREVIDKLGGFDPVYIPVYYDDRDYSLKAIEAGYRCVKAKASFVAHVRNATMNKTMDRSKIQALMERNGRIFYKRWGYPLKAVFVLRRPEGAGALLRKVCMDQNKIVLIAPAGSIIPYEHTNMKVLRFGWPVFDIAAAVFVGANRSRKRQKGIDVVLTDSPLFAGIAAACKGLSVADVVSGKDCGELEKRALPLVRDRKQRSKDLADA